MNGFLANSSLLNVDVILLFPTGGFAAKFSTKHPAEREHPPRVVRDGTRGPTGAKRGDPAQ